jgi:ArsR family transcriptional regulator, arsenate/arsenite/antimonite-responsive transcriptional repressor
VESGAVVRALASLAQEHRLSAYRLLVQAGPDGLAAGALAEALDIAASSLSFHIAQLANAGLVSQRRQGRSILYAADYAAMAAVMGYLTENCCGGAACVPAMDCKPASTTERDVA